MSEHLWRPHLESYLAVREAMGQSVRAERKLLGEFLYFADRKGIAGPIRAEWALDWACMLSPRRGAGGQAGPGPPLSMVSGCGSSAGRMGCPRPS